jgi:pimeloyl-ACP methyl ester carboxylesterase
MPPSLPLVVALLAAPAANLPTDLWQVAPETQGRPWWQQNAPRKDRAVLLIPGLKIHPLRPNRATRPELHDWQESRSELVKALARDADVFAFGYAQTVPVDAVAHTPGLREAVRQMRTAGYNEVVLIGHSAGGIVARQFAEAYPDAGVTKVIQVASPNAGSDLAAFFKTGYPKVQAPFVQSLAPAVRADVLGRNRAVVSTRVEAACVVCRVRGIDGDGMVTTASQWPADLQQQGVPAALAPVIHFEAMKAAASVKLIAELARERLVRWSPEQVDQARRVLFRDVEEKANGSKR